MGSSAIGCCAAIVRRLYTWLRKVCSNVVSFALIRFTKDLVGASPAQVDAALKGKLGMAMGLFEMMDLAGLDVGWRQRTELGLTKVENRNPRFRYSTLMDKLCEQGYFGQKTARGWYSYSATSPRAPVPCPEIEAIIDAHREEHV